MKKRNLLQLFAVLLMVLAMFLACSPENSNGPEPESLVGTWERTINRRGRATSVTQTIKMEGDKFTLSSTEEGFTPIEGNYSIEGNKITMTSKSGDVTLTDTFIAAGNEMYLKFNKICLMFDTSEGPKPFVPDFPVYFGGNTETFVGEWYFSGSTENKNFSSKRENVYSFADGGTFEASFLGSREDKRDMNMKTESDGLWDYEKDSHVLTIKTNGGGMMLLSLDERPMGPPREPDLLSDFNIVRVVGNGFVSIGMDPREIEYSEDIAEYLDTYIFKKKN